MGLSITSTPPLPWVAIPAKMFGKCLEHVQNCWVHLSSGWSPPPKRFGNVRKMFRKCSELVWPARGGEVGEAAASVPNIFRTVPNISEHFPNISEHFRTFAGV